MIQPFFFLSVLGGENYKDRRKGGTARRFRCFLRRKDQNSFFGKVSAIASASNSRFSADSLFRADFIVTVSPAKVILRHSERISFISFPLVGAHEPFSIKATVLF